jgi:hypothetical protein
MRPTGLQLPRDVFSGGHFGQHEPKFNRDFKGLFSQAYRKFESPLVRQFKTKSRKPHPALRDGVRVESDGGKPGDETALVSLAPLTPRRVDTTYPAPHAPGSPP